MTHAEALDGKFLPYLVEEQRKRFTPSELIMYQHAQDYRYISLYTSIYMYILVYTCIYEYIHVYTVIYGSCDRWKAIELKKTIENLKCSVDQSLTPRNSTPICTRECNKLYSFNMQEGLAYGGQDLDLWTRELENVVREIMKDPVFKGNQNFRLQFRTGRGRSRAEVVWQ